MASLLALNVIITLFSCMNAVTLVLFIVGVLLLFLEMLTPGFGVFGITGVCCLLSSIISHGIASSWNMVDLLIMIVFSLVVIIVAFFIIVSAAKKGKFDKTGIVNDRSSIEGESQATGNFTNLIGKSGTALVDLRPVGKAEIEGKVIEVVSESGFINAGESVLVIDAEGQRVSVQKNK